MPQDFPSFPGRQKQKEEDQCAGHDCTRVEPPARLELTTYGLQIRRSTSCSYEGISLSLFSHNIQVWAVTIGSYTQAWDSCPACTTPQ